MKLTRRTLFPFLSALILALATPGIAPAEAAPLSAGPALHFGNALPRYSLVVVGTGWAPHSRIGISVRVGLSSAGRELRTSADGSFAVGLLQVSKCSAPVIKAWNLAGTSKVLRSSRLGCAVPAENPTPIVRVLHGKALHPKVVRILANSSRALTMRLGQELVVQEEASPFPAYYPHADQAFLAEIITPAPTSLDCSGANCASTLTWAFIAVHTGSTALDLQPACRNSHPQCEIPDLGVRVSITP